MSKQNTYKASIIYSHHELDDLQIEYAPFVPTFIDTTTATIGLHLRVNAEDVTYKFEDIQPGALIDIEIGHERRPYSIAMAWRNPDSNTFTLFFYIRHIPGGKVTETLYDIIAHRRNDPIYITSPYRMFEVNEDAVATREYASQEVKEIPIVSKAFVATGTGIAPFLLYLQHNRSKDDPVTDIYLSVKNANELRGRHSYVHSLLYFMILRGLRSKEEIPKGLIEVPKIHLLFTREHTIDETLLFDAVSTAGFRVIEDTGYDRATMVKLAHAVHEKIRIHTQRDLDNKLYIDQVLKTQEQKYGQAGTTLRKYYAAGYGGMLRSVGNVCLHDLNVLHSWFAYEAFTS